jgi:hypothetical protein
MNPNAVASVPDTLFNKAPAPIAVLLCAVVALFNVPYPTAVLFAPEREEAKLAYPTPVHCVSPDVAVDVEPYPSPILVAVGLLKCRPFTVALNVQSSVVEVVGIRLPSD